MNPTNKEAHARAMVLKHVVVHALSTPPVYVLSDEFPAMTDQQSMELDQRCTEVAAQIVSSLKNAGLWSYASPNERLFLQSAGSQMDLYAHKAATWRMECAGVLMWALGMVIDWPAMDTQMPPDLLKELDIQTIGPFTTHPPLRATEEIAARRDLMELWHWRVRTRQLVEKGHPFPSDATFQQAGFHSYDDVIKAAAEDAFRRGDLPAIIDEDFVFLGKSFRSLSWEEYQIATSIIMERHYAMNWLCGFAPGNRWDDTPTPT